MLRAVQVLRRRKEVQTGAYLTILTFGDGKWYERSVSEVGKVGTVVCQCFGPKVKHDFIPGLGPPKSGLEDKRTNVEQVGLVASLDECTVLTLNFCR